MSNSLALDRSSLPEQAQSAPKTGFGAWFMTVLEKMVAAQSRQLADGAPLLYRFPPI